MQKKIVIAKLEKSIVPQGVQILRSRFVTSRQYSVYLINSNSRATNFCSNRNFN